MDDSRRLEVAARGHETLLTEVDNDPLHLHSLRAMIEDLDFKRSAMNRLAH